MTLSTAPALTPTVVTFWPHPRTVLGNEVRLLTTLERRLELLAEAGVEETLVVGFTLELAGMEPDAFVDELLRPIGTELVVAGADFRFGRGRRGDLATFEELGLSVERVELVPGISSTAIRELVGAGDVEGAARLLGRPAEVEGTVVSGDARGGTLGYPTANLRVDPDLLVPALRDLRGPGGRAPRRGLDRDEPALRRQRAPRRGLPARLRRADLYGERLIVELWRRLREERAFASEDELVAQITRDVEATRAAERPV
jgi:riboflavin kinase/FMN adenylyltransferase